jgi:hypothetical protein
MVVRSDPLHWLACLPPSLAAAENQEGETMRQTAERALEESVSLEKVQPYFVGNCPAGHAALGDTGTLFFHR